MIISITKPKQVAKWPAPQISHPSKGWKVESRYFNSSYNEILKKVSTLNDQLDALDLWFVVLGYYIRTGEESVWGEHQTSKLLIIDLFP